MPSRKSSIARLPKVPVLSWDDSRLLIESVVDYAIYMLDPEGRVATWNLGAEKIKGYRADEIIGEPFSRFFCPEDVAAGKPERELEVAREVGRFEDEAWRIRKDGSRFWASVVITALRDERGKLRGFGKVTRDLTGRRRAEEDLRRSEERLRLMVENAADYAIYMLDPSGLVTSWNLGAQRMKGYTADEIIGKNFSIFFPEEDVESGKPERELARALAEGRFEDEGFRVRKDGSRFWANAILTPVRDAHGKLIGLVKITRDLTALRDAQLTEQRLLRERTALEVAQEGERRLGESEERYRGLSQRLEIVFEGVADGITVQDREGRLLLANTAAAKVCGYSTAEELVNAPLSEVTRRFEILDEKDEPLPLDKLPGRRALDGEGVSSAVLHVRQRNSGRDWWSLVRASPLLGPHGEPEMAVNIWHDVSEERRGRRDAMFLDEATTALGASLEYDEMLSTLANVLVPRLADWCSVFLLEGSDLRNVAVTHVDPAKRAAAQTYRERFPTDPDRKRGVWDVIRRGKSQVYNQITDQMLLEAGRNQEHVELLRAVGIKAVLLVPICLRGEMMGVISLVSAESDRRYDEHDVALAEELGRRAGVALENARLYRAAQESAKSAEEANRAKDEFLATVSHELRTPLNAILGWSTLLKDRLSDPCVIRPIQIIHRNAQRQVQLIDDIMDVSRIITGKFRMDAKPVDFVHLVREAIEVVRPSAVAKDISIEFAPSTDFILLVADPDRLQQVAWNLLSNAVKFTEQGGNVRIWLGQKSANVILSVADTGKGIEPEFLPYVFDRFKQADSSITRRVGGLGLGLALVRHITELHGGRVTAESEGAGKGATFTISLPVRAVMPTASRDSSQPAARPLTVNIALSGIRVLVIDDEADALDLISAVLFEAGAGVDIARSAAEGFALLKRLRPDVLVSDLGMPDEDGYSLMRRVRALPPGEGGNVPSLALTAFAREEERRKAISAGFTMHLGKPVDPTALASAVANLATATDQ
jgi:PAS domain S-box-containing protein